MFEMHRLVQLAAQRWLEVSPPSRRTASVDILALNAAADNALPYSPPSARIPAPFSSSSRTTASWPATEAA